ncbi:MAG TPA: triple tyrosine motif-containing protein, partial [Chitinophagaceae bacterium]|nr:triple tyrosine motif-containing protein [Chitinophagaceae bacterium]
FIYIMEDSRRNLWLGTMRNGVVRVNPNNNSCTYFPSLVCDSSVPRSVNFIKPQFEDEEGNIWFDSFCGVIIYHPATNSFDEISFDPYDRFDNDGRGMVKAGNGIIWRITADYGLQRYNPQNKKFEVLRTDYKGSLKGQENLLEDKSGNLWFNTEDGVFRYEPESNHITAFKKETGYDIGAVILGYDAKRNELYTGDGGTLKITPLDKLFSKSEPPAIVFTSIHVNEKEFPFTTNLNEVKSISLNHQQNFLSFEFAALNFSYSNVNQYAYKLDGVDDDWVQSGNRNYAAYSNLRPGTYTFHVKGSNNNGVWNETGRSIIITIVPAWWQTGLFRAAVLIFIVNLIFFSTRFYYKQKLKLQQEQLEKQKAVERIRSKISSDIHDEIGAGLTKISLMAQRLKINFDNNKDIDAGMVNKITESSKEIVGNLSQIIWTANPKHDNLASLLAYIRNYASHFFEDTGIQYSIHFPADVPEQHIHPDVKHNLFLVIKESLNNIVKHAQASNVQIHFQYDNNHYAFTITDDGIGMDNLSGRDFGNGLVNMKNRMRAVNGIFEIASEKNKGTAIKLKGVIDY